MSSEVPFQIAVSDEKIQLLHKKLALATFPDEVENAGWDYGAPLQDIVRLVNRWKDGYDWRKHEKQINDEMPQFTRDIEVDGHGTLNIHYVHKKSKNLNAIPLLFVHGWPGSFLEVRKLLPLLTEESPEHPSFNVVAFSLPGYGFSEAPKKKGFALKEFAQVGNKLMLALGYNEYVTQGGDWGFWITHRIALMYGPEHSKAWHTNFPHDDSPTLTSKPLTYLSNAVFGFSQREKEGFKRTEWFNKLGSGYQAEQKTQPQTLGYGLADSPVGLLAWIYEKLVNWTDSYPWDDDEILTWISIYWFSRAGPAASLRIYYEVRQSNDGARYSDVHETKIPMGFSYFPREIIRLPKSWTKKKNLVFESEHNAGGHFAAYERPRELVGDLRNMFGKNGPAFDVVPGKNGYGILSSTAKL